MVRVVISNVSELEALQRKLRVLRAALPFIQKAAIKDYSTAVILREIHNEMKLKNFSQKIIDATFVGPTNVLGSLIRVHFISNYESDSGFDVSDAREEGTTHPNPTFPKKTGGVLRWVAKTGEVIFRKKSHPKGMERLLIIENTIKKNQSTALTGIQDQVNEKSLMMLGV